MKGSTDRWCNFEWTKITDEYGGEGCQGGVGEKKGSTVLKKW